VALGSVDSFTTLMNMMMLPLAREMALVVDGSCRAV
jgi:hypothetical protein